MIYERRYAQPVEYHMRREADALGIQYVPWKEVTEVGQWMLTDDDVVILCTRYKHIVEKRGVKKVSERSRYMVGNPVSFAYKHGKRPLTFLNFMDTKSSGLVAEEWWKTKLRNNPKLLSMLASAVLHGFPLKHRIHTYLNGSQRYMYSKEDWNVFYAIEKAVGNKNINARNIKVLYSTDGAKDMIRKEIARIIEERGIDAEEVFDIMKEALDIARSRKSAKDLLAVADRYAAVLAMPHTQRGSSAINQQGQLALPSAEENEAMYESILKTKGVEDAVIVG